MSNMIRRTDSADSAVQFVMELLAMVLRRKKQFALVFCSVIALVAIATLLATREYRSQAKLFLRLGRENASVEPLTSVGENKLIALPPSFEEEMNSVMDLLSSKGNVSRVVDLLGPDYVMDSTAGQRDNGTSSATAATAQAILPVSAIHSSDGPRAVTAAKPIVTEVAAKDTTDMKALKARDEAIRHLQRHLTVSAERKSLIITVECDANSPAGAQQILQTVLDNYISLHTNMYRVQNAYSLLSAESVKRQQQLSQAETELRELRDSTGVASVSEQRRLLLEQLSHLRSQQFDAQATAVAHQSSIKALESAMKQIPAERLAETTTGAANQGFDLMRQKLFDLEAQEKQLSSLYTDKFFSVQNVRNEIAGLRDILHQERFDRTEQKTAPNKNYEDLQLNLLLEQKELAKSQSLSGELSRQVAEVERQVNKLNAASVKIEQLERDVAIKDTTYKRYAQNVEEARMDEVIRERNISNISVAQAPTLSVRPVRPNILLNGLLGGVAATVIAFGSVWVSQRRHSDVANEGEKHIENGSPAVAQHHAGNTLVQA
jgi:uncharacterized protein involved in exopolysaccharide biosynthesis